MVSCVRRLYTCIQCCGYRASCIVYQMQGVTIFSPYPLRDDRNKLANCNFSLGMRRDTILWDCGH